MNLAGGMVMGHEIIAFPKSTVPWRFISLNMRRLGDTSAMPLHPSFFFVPIDCKKRAKELWTCTDFTCDFGIADQT